MGPQGLRQWIQRKSDANEQRQGSDLDRCDLSGRYSRKPEAVAGGRQDGLCSCANRSSTERFALARRLGVSYSKSAKQPDAAEKFVAWASSKDYIRLVAGDLGWASVPPGMKIDSRQSQYQNVAPFVAATLQAIQTADPTNPCLKKVRILESHFPIFLNTNRSEQWSARTSLVRSLARCRSRSL